MYNDIALERYGITEEIFPGGGPSGSVANSLVRMKYLKLTYIPKFKAVIIVGGGTLVLGILQVRI